MVVSAWTCDVGLKDPFGKDGEAGTADDDSSCRPAKDVEWSLDDSSLASLNKEDGAKVRLSADAAGKATVEAKLDKDHQAELKLAIAAAVVETVKEEAKAPVDEPKADNGKKDEAPGQVKQDEPPAAETVETPVDEPPADNGKKDEAPGQVKQDEPPAAETVETPVDEPPADNGKKDEAPGQVKQDEPPRATDDHS